MFQYEKKIHYKHNKPEFCEEDQWYVLFCHENFEIYRFLSRFLKREQHVSSCKYQGN